MPGVNLLPFSVVQKIEETGIPQDSFIFYQDGRWVFQVGHDMASESMFHHPLIDALGPFEIHEVDISFILLLPTLKYRITKIRGRTLTNDEKCIGIHAPVVPITLKGFARTTVNIPDDATHFCWLYPPTFIPNDDNITLDSSDESNLLRIGGFAYFNTKNNNIDQLQLIRIYSLVVAANNGLTFEKRCIWRKEFTEPLWKENRFQRVTLPCLLEKGAKYFAFVNPYELLFSEDRQSSWKPSPHGAF
ncbi:unnamed protein product, partial [Rotaria sp. Silwood2]